MKTKLGETRAERTDSTQKVSSIIKNILSKGVCSIQSWSYRVCSPESSLVCREVIHKVLVLSVSRKQWFVKSGKDKRGWFQMVSLCWMARGIGIGSRCVGDKNGMKYTIWSDPELELNELELGHGLKIYSREINFRGRRMTGKASDSYIVICYVCDQGLHFSPL